MISSQMVAPAQTMSKGPSYPALSYPYTSRPVSYDNIVYLFFKSFLFLPYRIPGIL